MKKTLLLALISLLAAPSQAVTIDDFNVSYFNTVQTSTWVDFQNGTMLSGERDVMLEVLSNSFNVFSDLDINGSGTAVFSNGFNMSANTYLQYDGNGDETANTGPGVVLTNGGLGVPLLTGFNNAVRIHFLGNDLNVNVTAVARLSGAVIATNSALRVAGSGIGDMDIAFNPSALAATDSLTFVFSGAPSADFAISKIEAVPEPGSIVVALLGLSLALKRRQCQR